VSALLLPIAVPAAASVAVAACAARARLATALAAGGALLGAASLALAARAPATEVHVLGLALALGADAVALPFAAASALLAVAVAVAGVRGLPSRRAGLVQAALLLALSAVTGALLAADVETLLLAWEGLLLPLALLVGATAGDARAALRAFTVCAVADLALVAGLGLLGTVGGTDALRGAPLAGAVATVAVALVAAGAAARGGAMPFQGWVADAAEHGASAAVAFVPLGAGKLLTAALLARVLGGAGPGSSATAPLVVLGVLSVVLGGLCAAVQTDATRRVAHLSAVHTGAVLLALAPATPAAAGVARGLALAGAIAFPALLAAAVRRPASAVPPRGLARELLDAERALDPATLASAVTGALARAAFRIERGVNALYDGGATTLAHAGARAVRRAHTGSHATYLVWALAGFVALLGWLLKGA
jgi:formate hydrogenlyase subunit 3/multisubunit Na+/H+ antiporter MnhD subunit